MPVRSSTVEVTVEIADPDSVQWLLEVKATTSSKAGVIPTGNVVCLPGSGNMWQISMTVLDINYAGSVSIDIQATDEHNGMGIGTINLLFVHPPTITIQALYTKPMGFSPVMHEVAVELFDQDTAAQDLVTAVSIGNTTLIPLETASVVGTSGDRTLTFQVPARLWGTTTIEVTVQDEYFADSATLAVEITCPPTLLQLPPRSLLLNQPILGLPLEVADPDSTAMELEIEILGTSDASLCPTKRASREDTIQAKQVFDQSSHLYQEHVVVNAGMQLTEPSGCSTSFLFDYIPPKNQWGSCEVSFRVSDGWSEDIMIMRIDVMAPPIAVWKRKFCMATLEEVSSWYFVWVLQ